MKLSALHHKVLYSVVSGSDADGSGLAVDRVGDAYMVGMAASGFALRGAVERLKSTGQCDLFPDSCRVAVIAKLSPSGHLLYSSYLGGPGYNSSAESVAVDSRGYMYVTGSTNGGLATLRAPQPDDAGGDWQDAFVTVLNRSGSRVLYSTYLGGTGTDWGTAVAIDHAGAVYVAGTTSGLDFPGLKPFRKEGHLTWLVKLPSIR
jgi:hypothetical protein